MFIYSLLLETIVNETTTLLAIIALERTLLDAQYREERLQGREQCSGKRIYIPDAIAGKRTKLREARLYKGCSRKTASISVALCALHRVLRSCALHRMLRSGALRSLL